MRSDRTQLSWDGSCPAPRVYHVNFGSLATNGVSINRKEPLKLESAGTATRWVGVVAAPLTSPSHTCYHMKFGSSASKGMCINGKEPQIWGSLGHRLLAVGA